jgi:hypothetical protein
VDIDKVIAYVKGQGWKVDIDANGYRRFFNPAGEYVVRYPATPSNPHRRFLDVVTALKAHGVMWPPLSKTELRAQRNANRKEEK